MVLNLPAGHGKQPAFAFAPAVVKKVPVSQSVQ
jgi:hypothetical protein